MIQGLPIALLQLKAGKTSLKIYQIKSEKLYILYIEQKENYYKIIKQYYKINKDIIQR